MVRTTKNEGRVITWDSIRDNPSQRWHIRRKTDLCAALAAGVCTTAQVIERFPDFSEDELASWVRRYQEKGRDGVRTRVR